ncbi:hypothetical protein M409DRAFT_56689 [Zasmidium cellare ATCC 36951]|uniref:Zn(2)-C6 fungal-type domain-containing protein n=1 Tax=Zasmidium cellare ATCC 36951 TaxID=1080233 RepID=A0A6A6CB94_ZASCE|nr:uncharacterized protein M409DRAFT_56689 [Zasmidium cellare ATCC 36951]KAF2164424.1 hypothetical protein M409DRAFT_56689 [Zasmidium cellare ATCC 36951]
MTKAKASASGSRRSQVANACQACRASKVKCSGKHPTCSRCTARGIECSYDVSEEGMTRRQHLRQEFDEQRRELDSAMNILDVLRHGSDQEATETLARIRLGETLREANDGIENARSLKNEETASSAGDVQSAPDTPSTHAFDHQGHLDHARARASFSTASAIPSSNYWSQGPPQPQVQAFAPSSSRRSSQRQQQQQQQNLGTLETQNFTWPSPLSSDPQSAVSEWSGIGIQQFEQLEQFDFEMDSDMQQPDGSERASTRGDSDYSRPTQPVKTASCFEGDETGHGLAHEASWSRGVYPMRELAERRQEQARRNNFPMSSTADDNVDDDEVTNWW